MYTCAASEWGITPKCCPVPLSTSLFVRASDNGYVDTLP